MERLIPFVVFLIPVAAILVPVGIVAVVLWYKSRQRELQIQESLRLHEFEHLQRLKELEVELGKTRAHGPERVIQT
jgi:hypothetical protein